MRKILKFCEKQLKQYFTILIAYLLISLISSILMNLMPYLNGTFIDQLLYSHDKTFLVKFSVIALIIVGVGYLLSYFGSLLSIFMQSKISFSIYKQILSHINSIPMSIINNMNLPAMNQRISTDISIVVSFSISTLQNITVNFIILLISFMFVFLKNKWFSILIVLFCLLYLISNKLLKNKIYTVSYELKEQQNNYFAKTHEQYNSIKFVKTQGIKETFINRLNEPFSNLLKASIRYQKISYLFSGMDTLLSLSLQIIMIFFGGAAILRGEMTIGEFTIINSYISMSTGAIKYFYNLGKNIQDTRSSLDRLEQLLNIQLDTNGYIEEKNINEIRLCDLSFGYNDTKLFEKLNFKFQKGKIYSVIGQNGTGKSSLIYNILGFYNNYFSGKIIINDKLIEDYDMDYLRRETIAYLEQIPHIVSGSISDNIFLLNNKVDDEYLYKLKELGLLTFDKYSYLKEINSSSDNLSGGEKLKISLARVFYKDASLILLDEPSSMLDNASIGILIDILNNIKDDKIIIIITHDEKLISLSDEVLEIK